jgi:ketosteroid isomerase-like protein
MATAALERVFAAYRAAWRSHDLDAIVALHHPEGSFWLHTAGQTIGVGREAIRARFAGTLALLPDIAFDSLRVHWGEAFLVHEMSASGTPAVPGQRGAVRFDFVDVIEFRDGLVWTKNSYLDAAPLAAFMQVPTPPPPTEI